MLLAACGAKARPARPPEPSPPKDASADAHADAAVDAGPDALALVTLRRDELAPGARELATGELRSPSEPELRLPKLDVTTCLRVAFRAEAPAKVTLLDARGRALGEADAAEGALGPSGPVCLTAGDSPTVRVEGGGRVRVVVWASP